MDLPAPNTVTTARPLGMPGLYPTTVTITADEHEVRFIYERKGRVHFEATYRRDDPDVFVELGRLVALG